MRHDAALLPKLGPQLLREKEMGRVIAVQVADLAATELEGELAALARACFDVRPGGDLFGDPPACRDLRMLRLHLSSVRAGRVPNASGNSS